MASQMLVFDKFWHELSTYLVEVTPAVDDRRHGSTLHMPIAISVGDLRDIISERLCTKFPEEPSVEWLRLQLAPRNPYSSNSLRNTGKFDVMFAVQIRQLRKSHPDSKYVMVLLKYVKEYAVRFFQHTMLASVDDSDYTCWRAQCSSVHRCPLKGKQWMKPLKVTLTSLPH